MVTPRIIRRELGPMIRDVKLYVTDGSFTDSEDYRSQPQSKHFEMLVRELEV
jgi:hypothetical protein